MLGRGVLSTLYTLSQQRTYTLTMYLDIDQNKQSNRRRGYVVQAEALLKGLKSQQARSDRLDTACRQALTLVRTFKPKGKAALIVIHPETKLRELVQVELPFPPPSTGGAAPSCGRWWKRWTSTSATAWCSPTTSAPASSPSSWAS